MIADPSGNGKSYHFTAGAFGVDGVNVDVRAGTDNGGSFRSIPRAVRRRVQKACEAFVEDHIARGQSLAVETTLRSDIAIEQARRTRSASFEMSIIFVSAGRADNRVHRVRLHARSDGHWAPEADICDVCARSLVNPHLEPESFDRIELHDNAIRGAAPRFVG